MLGSAMVSALQGGDGIRVSATARTAPEEAPVSFATYAVGETDLSGVLTGLGEGDYVVNCLGMLRNRIDDANLADRIEATRVNAQFPHELAQHAESRGFRVIQIATDCVYSGARGAYDEGDLHDPVDVYGATKSLGEIPHERFLNLRCSIIGRELHGRRSLLEWLLSQPQNATISGYLDHRWNGVTTTAFAALVRGLILEGSQLSGTHHFIPADEVTKSELSSLILAAFDRQDVTVVPTVTGDAVDRTLATRDPDLNARHWRLAGFAEPPTVAQMVAALP